MADKVQVQRLTEQLKQNENTNRVNNEEENKLKQQIKLHIMNELEA